MSFLDSIETFAGFAPAPPPPELAPDVAPALAPTSTDPGQDPTQAGPVSVLKAATARTAKALQVSATGWTIANIEQDLVQLGYLAAASGRDDAASQAALSAFQSAHGCTVDRAGVPLVSRVGPQTQAALVAALGLGSLARPASPLVPAPEPTPPPTPAKPKPAPAPAAKSSKALVVGGLAAAAGLVMLAKAHVLS